MVNAKLKWVEDVEFIFDEIGRFQALERQWFETHKAPEELKQGFLWQLPHPTEPKRKVPCGRAGVERLDGLARVAAERAGIGNQLDALTIRPLLAKSLLRRFGIEGRSLEIQHVERAMSEAARAAKRSLHTITHYVPCHLMVAQSPNEFALGSVKFLSRKAFRRMIAKRLWQSREQNRKSHQFLADVTRYYKSFGWVAEVTILDCDEKTSEKMAIQAVTYALDCLHLFFGPTHTSRMIVGGPAIHRDSRGRFLIQEEDLKFSASYGGPGEVGFEDDWTKFFADPETSHIVQLFGTALEAAVNPKLVRPISERFLDAVSWYGEATRETSPAAKVVKYVTALERMLMTDEKDNITDLVSQRVAALCFDPGESDSFSHWQKKSQEAYGLRSRLVHGSFSQRDQRVPAGAWLAADIGRTAILNALSAFGHLGLRTDDAKRGQIANWFNGLVRHARRLEQQFSEQPTAKPDS